MNSPRGVCQLLKRGHEAQPRELPRPSMPAARQQRRSNVPGRGDADASLPGKGGAVVEKRSSSPIRRSRTTAETQTAAMAVATAEGQSGWRLSPRPPSKPPGPGGWSCAPDPERFRAEPAEAERRSAIARAPWRSCALSLGRSNTSIGASWGGTALPGVASEGGTSLVMAAQAGLSWGATTLPGLASEGDANLVTAGQAHEPEDDEQEAATVAASLAEEMRLRENGPCQSRGHRTAAAIERLLGQRQPHDFRRGTSCPDRDLSRDGVQVTESKPRSLTEDLSPEGHIVHREQSHQSDTFSSQQVSARSYSSHQSDKIHRHATQKTGLDNSQRSADIPDPETSVEISGVSETLRSEKMSIFRESAFKAMQLVRVSKAMSSRCSDHQKEIEQRRQQRQREEKKLRAFDRRRAPAMQMKRASSDGDLQGDEADEGLHHGPFDAAIAMRSGKYHLPFAAEEIKRKEMKFSVVKWSCQKSNGPAKSLSQQNGRWEAINGRIRNEYVVFELEEPSAISEISFFLPGNDSAPHQLNMKYSTESSEGPWRDAWRFEVTSKEDTFIKSNFDYQQCIQSFKNVLVTVCPGSIEEAWSQFLDTNGDGRLSFPEFSNAVHAIKLHIQALPHSKKGSVAESMKVLWDAQSLFESLDVDRSGKVELKDLLPNGGSPPEGTWWKLTVLNNWGSPKRLQIIGPVSLCAKVRTTCTFSADLGQFFRRTESGGCDIDYVSAFDTKLLTIDKNEINIRRLSRKYNLKNSLVDAVHKYFNEADQDKSGYIEEEEFNRLLLTLHGAKNHSEVPRQRLRFFWQQADKNSDGLIDFEELLVWFARFFVSESDFESSNFVANAGFIGSYYNGLGLSRARGATVPLTPSAKDAEWNYM